MNSVCIATYNGEKFIEEQIRSILLQLDSHDEIVISDDHSTDKNKSCKSFLLNSFIFFEISLYSA